MNEYVLLIIEKLYAKDILRTTNTEKNRSKSYKKTSSHWEGLRRNFSSSPEGIEEMSRLIPFFFMQQR